MYSVFGILLQLFTLPNDMPASCYEFTFRIKNFLLRLGIGNVQNVFENLWNLYQKS